MDMEAEENREDEERLSSCVFDTLADTRECCSV
jgi:hypothetical protein